MCLCANRLLLRRFSSSSSDFIHRIFSSNFVFFKCSTHVSLYLCAVCVNSVKLIFSSRQQILSYCSIVSWKLAEQRSLTFIHSLIHSFVHSRLCVYLTSFHCVFEKEDFAMLHINLNEITCLKIRINSTNCPFVCSRSLAIRIVFAKLWRLFNGVQTNAGIYWNVWH